MRFTGLVFGVYTFVLLHLEGHEAPSVIRVYDSQNHSPNEGLRPRLRSLSEEECRNLTLEITNVPEDAGKSQLEQYDADFQIVTRMEHLVRMTCNLRCGYTESYKIGGLEYLDVCFQNNNWRTPSVVDIDKAAHSRVEHAKLHPRPIRVLFDEQECRDSYLRSAKLLLESGYNASIYGWTDDDDDFRETSHQFALLSQFDIGIKESDCLQGGEVYRDWSMGPADMEEEVKKLSDGTRKAGGTPPLKSMTSSLNLNGVPLPSISVYLSPSSPPTSSPLSQAPCEQIVMGKLRCQIAQGGKPFFASKPNIDQVPTRICWHPHESWLAVGWGPSSGNVSVVDPLERVEHTVKMNDAQLASIRCLIWSADELVAVDECGIIVAFRPSDHNDARTLQTLIVKSGAVTVDELPTDICCKFIERSLWESRSSLRQGQTGSGSAEAKRREKFAELLSHQHRIMDVEEPLSSSASRQQALTSHDLVLVYIISTDRGGVFLYEVNSASLSRMFQADSSIRQLLDTGDAHLKGGRQGHLLAISQGMMFYQLKIERKLANDKIKVKLGGKAAHFSMIRVDCTVIALCYGEREIRIWDLAREDSATFQLNADKGYDAKDSGEGIVCLSYCSKKDSVSGATATGKLATWRRHCRNNTKRVGREFGVEEQWILQTAVLMGAEITQMTWSHTAASALAVNSGSSVQIFLSQGIDFFADTQYAAVQLGQQSLSIVKLTQPTESRELQLSSSIKGFSVTGSKLLLWDEKTLRLDEIAKDENSVLSTKTVVTLSPTSAVLNALLVPATGQIYILHSKNVSIASVNWKDTANKTIELHESEGCPTLMHTNGTWLVLGTSRGYLRIYDVAEMNSRIVHHSTGVGRTASNQFERFAQVKINATGNKVSFTVQKKTGEIHERLFVWDAENNSLAFFSFHSGLTDQQQSELGSGASAGGQRPKTASERKIEREQTRYQLPYHLPGNHYWNMGEDCKGLLVCEANHIGGLENNFLLTMFVTSEHGMQMHDIQPRPSKAETLIALAVPYVYFLKNIESDDEDDLEIECSISRLILRRTLREFVGVDPGDGKGIESMVSFSYYLCAGQMDNAFKAIKFIKRADIWEHMARMCVKTRRLDVARVCLGNMGSARAARALRMSIARGESVDSQAARLALELGMIEEAVSIYTSAGRHDLVNKIHQSQGKWQEAFDVASKLDRIHFRNTQHNYAKYLESVGAIEAAIENYEKANVAGFEVPRMLADDMKILEFYIQRRDEKELLKWWAKYLESVNEVEAAKNYYGSAGDHFSVVRILCYNQRVQEAVELVDRSGDKAAAFHLGRHFESLEDHHNAVRYFERAGAYDNAIRLAKEYDMTEKLAHLSLMAGDSDLMLEIAGYYEDKPGHADKAVMLYHKAGMIGKALDLAFKTEQFSALDLIARELNADSDPRVLERAALFYSNNQQDRKAVELLAYANKYSDAVALCSQKNVPITEELDTLLTPPKTDAKKDVKRLELLDEIARCCLQQGSYRLAAKKFTQAGNNIEAMRALVKSGDTAKVTLFANTARTKEIYLMAGNYLQTLNWKENAALMKQIEHFYHKAGAHDSIASFYEACAQVEIDDYHDYEKAVAAYNEAIRCLRKKLGSEKATEAELANIRGSSALLRREGGLRARVERIGRFLAIRNLYAEDPGEAVRQLAEMAEERDVDEAVRKGDLYAMLIAHHAKRENFRKAWQLVEKCTNDEAIDVRSFVGKEVLDAICTGAGVPLMTTADSNGTGSDVEEPDGIDYSHAMQKRINRGDAADDDDDIQ